MSSEVYRLYSGELPILISLPHGGTYVPPELIARMTPEALTLPDTDWHVERLYDFARQRGCGLITATPNFCFMKAISEVMASMYGAQ